MTTATGSLSEELRTFYDKNLLSRLLPNLVWMLFGQPRQMPKREGQTVQFRRFSSLSLATTPLTEGVTPSGNTLTVSSLTATPKQYGDYVEISDVLDMTAPDPVLIESGELLGEQAAQSMDSVVRDIVIAGTTVQYAGGHSQRSDVTSSDKLSLTEIRKAVRTLHNNKAKKITSILDASTGIGTKPIAAGYVGIVGPNGLYDLKNDSAFVTVEQYGSKVDLLPFEVGAMDEVRFIRTDQPAIFSAQGSGGINVEATLIIGRDAYGVISPEGITNIVKDFGAGQDPLNQRATSGWKAYFTAVVLQQLALLRLEHAVS